MPAPPRPVAPSKTPTELEEIGEIGEGISMISPGLTWSHLSTFFQWHCDNRLQMIAVISQYVPCVAVETSLVSNLVPKWILALSIQPVVLLLATHHRGIDLPATHSASGKTRVIMNLATDAGRQLSIEDKGDTGDTYWRWSKVMDKKQCLILDFWPRDSTFSGFCFHSGSHVFMMQWCNQQHSQIQAPCLAPKMTCSKKTKNTIWVRDAQRVASDNETKAAPIFFDTHDTQDQCALALWQRGEVAQLDETLSVALHLKTINFNKVLSAFRLLRSRPARVLSWCVDQQQHVC